MSREFVWWRMGGLHHVCRCLCFPLQSIHSKKTSLSVESEVFLVWTDYSPLYPDIVCLLTFTFAQCASIQRYTVYGMYHEAITCQLTQNTSWSFPVMILTISLNIPRIISVKMRVIFTEYGKIRTHVHVHTHTCTCLNICKCLAIDFYYRRPRQVQTGCSRRGNNILSCWCHIPCLGAAHSQMYPFAGCHSWRAIST